jgi:hypothetical protein
VYFSISIQHPNQQEKYLHRAHQNSSNINIAATKHRTALGLKPKETNNGIYLLCSLENLEAEIITKIILS